MLTYNLRVYFDRVVADFCSLSLSLSLSLCCQFTASIVQRAQSLVVPMAEFSVTANRAILPFMKFLVNCGDNRTTRTIPCKCTRSISQPTLGARR